MLLSQVKQTSLSQHASSTEPALSYKLANACEKKRKDYAFWRQFNESIHTLILHQAAQGQMHGAGHHIMQQH